MSGGHKFFVTYLGGEGKISGETGGRKNNSESQMRM